MNDGKLPPRADDMLDRLCHQRVKDASHHLEGEIAIRGVVSKCHCWNCGKSRFDDGTACRGCGKYMKDGPNIDNEEGGLS